MSDLQALTERLNSVSRDRLPGHLGMSFEALEGGAVAGWFDVEPHHLAPNGFLHAASIIALADTAAGYGCFGAKPAKAIGFTTIELKSNFLGTVTSGRVEATAKLIHRGRTTQVWDAEATSAGNVLALFRCTQMILYPKSPSRNS